MSDAAVDGCSPGSAQVVYFEHELLPGKPMFRCERLASSLQVSSCAGMWREANDQAQAPERLFRCAQCPVGAKHAGVADASMSALRGTGICARCHRTDMRLIGGNICVSCKNREYECIKGRNAKGKVPQKHAPLDRRAVRYVEDGVAKVLVRKHTVGSEELVVELLRDSVKRVVLGRGCVRLRMRQAELNFFQVDGVGS